MTANDLLKMACDVCFESPADYQANAVALTNGVLAQSFDYNNDRRRYKGMTELESPPLITKMEDEIPYESEISVGLSYLLVSKLLYDDGDLNKCMYWQNQAFDLLQSGRKATYY